MNVKNIGSNQTEVVTSNGTVVLVSYSTPVAAIAHDGKLYRTSKKHSVTTSKHINKWIDVLLADSRWLGGRVEEKPQEYFDSL